MSNPELDAYRVTIGGVHYVLAELDTGAFTRWQRAAKTKAEDEQIVEGLRFAIREIDGVKKAYDDLVGREWLPKKGKHFFALQRAFNMVVLGVNDNDPLDGMTAISGG